jgi:anti-sigma factor RsiW
MTDLSCKTGVELLMDYLEGLVPDEVRAVLETHVAGCPRCAAFVDSYLATPRILRDATATAAMPPELQRSLLAFLRARRGEGPQHED